MALEVRFRFPGPVAGKCAPLEGRLVRSAAGMQWKWVDCGGAAGSKETGSSELCWSGREHIAFVPWVERHGRGRLRWMERPPL